MIGAMQATVKDMQVLAACASPRETLHNLTDASTGLFRWPDGATCSDTPMEPAPVELLLAKLGQRRDVGQALQHAVEEARVAAVQEPHPHRLAVGPLHAQLRQRPWVRTLLLHDPGATHEGWATHKRRAIGGIARAPLVKAVEGRSRLVSWLTALVRKCPGWRGGRDEIMQ